MLGYARKEFSPNPPPRNKKADEAQMMRRNERRENGKPLTGTRSGRGTVKSGGDAEQTGFVLKAARLIDGMRARLAVREQGAVSLRGRTDDPERDLRGAEKTPDNKRLDVMCARTHAAVFRRSFLFLFSQPVTLDMHLPMFFFFLLFFC